MLRSLFFLTALLAGLPTGALSADDARPFPSATIDAQHKDASVTAGPITAILSTEPRKGDGYTEMIPILRLFADNRLALTNEGVSAGDWVQGVAEIAAMDPANDIPEVVFSSYSGGAHCCTQVTVATKLKDGTWKAVDMGEWDGGGDYLEDANGDGLAEFVTVDQRFLYAFDCYACSAAPLTIQTVRGGEIVDVTRDPSFQPKLRKWAKALEGWRQSNGEFQPGFYAGWIAAKSLVGEGPEAWAAMMKAYDPAKDDGVETCRDTGLFGECNASQRVTVPFPKALKAFLDANGYTF